jgi:hypothetical protein
MDVTDGSSAESLTVFEVCGNVFEDKRIAHSVLRRAWGSMPGDLFKVTMMPRRQGLRVWIDGEYSELWSPFLIEQGVKAGAQDCRVRMMSNVEVAKQRQQDKYFETTAKSLEDEVTTRGLRVADNLATLLGKRKRASSVNTQRRVSHLMDFVSTVNTVVKQKVRVKGQRLSEHLESVEKDEDDEQSEAEDG